MDDHPTSVDARVLVLAHFSKNRNTKISRLINLKYSLMVLMEATQYDAVWY
jgi:hypothetical protein